MNSIEVSVLVAARLPRAANLTAALRPLSDLLRSRCGDAFEILVVPFGREGVVDLGGVAGARLLPPVRKEIARGEAVRQAFTAARGRVFLTFDGEQPCDVSFFDRALTAVDGGADLVRANRRLGATRFRIPVSVLPKVYFRHRLGVAFNRLVRLLLPVETSDTHAGNMAMSHRMATTVFALQQELGFVFWVELSVIAVTHRYVQIDMPERLYLQTEKTPGRVVRELSAIATALPQVWWRYIRGSYADLGAPQAITADDWGISPAVNRAIVDLVRTGVVRRVSMLANGDHFDASLDELRELARAGLVQIGLHFDLTHRTRTSPSRLLARWLFRNKTLRDEATNELRSQLVKLRAAGLDPVYLDGHHHIHLLPGLLNLIGPILREEAIREVRIPYDPSLWRSGKAPINILALLARGAVARLGFRFRSCYYPSARDFQNPARLRARIARQPDLEVIVHPAVEDDFDRYAVADDYSTGRVVEYQVLRSLARH